MSIGSAVSNFGRAEPIRIQEFKVVWKILAEMRWRREIFDVLACCFALIGRNGNRTSGFSLSRSSVSDDPPTSWHSMNRLEFAMKRVCCVVIGQPSWAVCSSTWPNQEQRSNGLYFFVDTSRRNVVWPGHMPVPMAETLNVMQLRFRVHMCVGKSQLSQSIPNGNQS